MTTRASAAAWPSSAPWPGVSIAIDDRGGRYYFDPAAAQNAVEFFPTFLEHHKGEFAGRAFDLAPWQSELVIRPLFGWKRATDGLRRFRKVYIEVPKKNGKTQLCAGLALLLLYCDQEPGAEVYCCAADKDNARLVFDEAKAMVEDCDLLQEQAEVLATAIVLPHSRSALKVISADARTKHGPNIHGLIIDELHAQPDRELYDTLTKGVAARRQPVIAMITTAGNDLESICYEEHEYAEKVIAGAVVDDSYLPVVFGTPPDADWRDPAVWARVNPGLGVTVKADYLESECAAATAEPRKLNAFKRLHLNIWTQQHRAWLQIDQWDRGRVEALPVGNREKRLAFAGLDLSSKLDLTACVILVRHELPAAEEIVVDLGPMETPAPTDAPPRKRLNINYRVELVPFFWLPAETLAARVKDDRIPYDVWRDAGFLRVTEGSVVDYDQVFEELVEQILPQWGVAEIAYDPWNALQMALNLQSKGFTLTEVPQNFKHLSEPSKLFEALVTAGRVTHYGNAVMRRCVENVAIQEDRGENIRPVKPSKKKRIDGVAAAINALARLMVAKPPKRSRYASGPVEPLWAKR